jgi:beta-mannosidase
MKTIPLNAQWTVTHFLEGAFTVHDPEELRRLDIPLLAAAVPGNVELDLLRAGEIEDPYIGSNVQSLRSLETHEWWYLGTFSTPPELKGKRIDLVFHGVDCLATYWLNGAELGETSNMFIEHRFDVTRHLRADAPNELAVRICSAVLAARRYQYDPAQMAMSTNWDQLWIRKAPHSYGWDIMPRAVSAGIWRPVELQVHETMEWADIYYHTIAANEDTASLGVHYQFRTEDALLNEYLIRVSGVFEESTFIHTAPVSFTAGEFAITFPRPALWWPRGYGKANLYNVTAELLYKGNVVDTRVDKIGVRTIELIRTEITTAEQPGEFLFRVNNIPVLCKGSNWVPADMFHSRDSARYDAMLDLAVDIGCNILRCWGGNVYEDHAFFDRCDREGLMVWQDFAMACACYPQTPEFQEVIRKEAVSVVRKLRNHASLALWCGDNECDDSFRWRSLDPAHNKLTREVLPEVVHQCDPYRPYLPSSPYWSPQVVKTGNTNLMPEQHLWGPRDYYKSLFYTESTNHFTSEIGYHGSPNIGSIKRFLDPEFLWPWRDNLQWQIHCTDPVPGRSNYGYRVQLMADQIAEMFGSIPSEMEDFVLASQISQAEAKKFFVEMTRLRKWRRTGIIWWNLIDGWPQFSDAVVDYYFGRKLAYHYLKRVQQPVCLMIDEPENWRVRVIMGNDTQKPAQGTYRVWDGDTSEELLAGGYSSLANENRELGAIRASRGEQRLLLMSWTVDERTCGNHYIHGAPPFNFQKYQGWLRLIASLPDGFNTEEVGK